MLLVVCHFEALTQQQMSLHLYILSLGQAQLFWPQTRNNALWAIGWRELLIFRRENCIAELTSQQTISLSFYHVIFPKFIWIFHKVQNIHNKSAKSHWIDRKSRNVHRPVEFRDCQHHVQFESFGTIWWSRLKLL